MSAENGRDALGHNALTEVICEMVCILPIERPWHPRIGSLYFGYLSHRIAREY